MVSVCQRALSIPGAAYLAVLLSLAVLLTADPAGAQPSGKFPYHEVTRFGGLDASAFKAGTPTPGRFLEPTGFAVDPEGIEMGGKKVETIYVADRTSSAEGHEGGCDVSKRCADWRIQELSATGAVLGTTTFTLPVGAELPSGGREASMIAGLAVDHAAGRLYALVMGPLDPPGGKGPKDPGNPYHEHATAAQELLAWSTTPEPCTGKCETGGALSPAAEEGVTGDPLGSTGGLVSSQAQLENGQTPLYDPQGIVVDHLPGATTRGPVAVEATNLKSPEPSPKDEPNPHIVQSEDIEYREFEESGDTVVQAIATQKETGPNG